MGLELSKPVPSPLRENPWPGREDINFSQQALERSVALVKGYQVPPRVAPRCNNLTLCFVGNVGAGKSQTYCSIDGLLLESEAPRVSRIADTGLIGSGTVTKRLAKYSVLPGITICDTAGLEDGPLQGHERCYIGALLDGHLHDGNDMTSRAFQGGSASQTPKLQDRVHCIIYLLSLKNASNESACLQTLMDVKGEAHKRGIPFLIALTKADAYDHLVREDTSNIFLSKKIWKLVEDLSMKTGVTLNSIFPIRNFCSEMSPTPGPGVLILSMLKVALDAASDYLRGQVRLLDNNDNVPLGDIGGNQNIGAAAARRAMSMEFTDPTASEDDDGASGFMVQYPPLNLHHH